MSQNLINEKEVDAIIMQLLEKKSQGIELNVKEFLDLLKFSLSLNTMEKKRVIDAVPTLSQFQFDELIKVFSEERIKFKELAKDHPEDIKKLVSRQQTEWIELGDLYKSEEINKFSEKQDQSKIDEIKAGLGL